MAEFDPTQFGAVAVDEPTQPFDPTAHGAVPVQEEQPSIIQKTGRAIVDTLKGFLPQSVEDVALAPATMFPGVGQAAKLLSNVAFGREPSEGLSPLQGIPVVQRIPQIIQAEKTPALSQERFTTGAGVLADLGMLAGFKAGLREIPKLADVAEPLIGRKAPSTPMEAAVEPIPTTPTEGVPNAVQEPSAGEILQRQPQETGTTGSERVGVEPSVQGQEPTEARQGTEAQPPQAEVAPTVSGIQEPVAQTGAVGTGGAKLVVGNVQERLAKAPETLDTDTLHQAIAGTRKTLADIQESKARGVNTKLIEDGLNDLISDWQKIIDSRPESWQPVITDSTFEALQIAKKRAGGITPLRTAFDKWKADTGTFVAGDISKTGMMQEFARKVAEEPQDVAQYFETTKTQPNIVPSVRGGGATEATPSVPEAPVPTTGSGIQKESAVSAPKEEAPTGTGISNQRLTEAYGDSAPVATTGRGPGAWKDEGLSRLDNFQKTGDVKNDPYSVLTNLREGKVPVSQLPSDVSLLRAEHQRLLEDARNAEGTPEYADKSQAALDMATAIKGVAHGPASDVFRALQEYDKPRYDNVTDFDQALRERENRESTSVEKTQFKKIADDVSTTMNGAEKTINDVQKRISKFPRMSFDEAAKNIRDQFTELTKDCGL